MSMSDTSAPLRETLSPLKRLFLGRRPAKGIVWFSVPGGAPLYLAGGQAEALYLVRSGRLAVMHEEEGRPARVLGVIHPGEPVGEMALFAGTPHGATVVALRDSEVLALPREAFLLETRRRPELMSELARLMVLRARATPGAGMGEPDVFGFVSLCPSSPARPLVERLAARLRGQGRTVAIAGVEALDRSSDGFSELERSHDYVLLSAEASEGEWRQVCGRQVDQLFLVGRGDHAPPTHVPLVAADAVQQNRLVDLVLTRPGEGAPPRESQAWLDATGLSRLLHVADGSLEDLDRLARTLTGSAVGLVLSGGGARAYAHVGVLRALEEAGCPVDSVGGASMGAIIGAALCMGLSVEELEARVRETFVKSSPVGDIAFPIISMSRGLRVRDRLRESFGEAEFADLRRPFFCVSSNLTTGLPQVHRMGVVRHALRASAALPGVLPPVVENGEVLVDGGVLRNLPTDILRETHRGPVIGVDVALTEELEVQDVSRPPSVIRWVLSGAWRKGPPIVALLIRSATVTTHREFAAAREASDVLITPEIEGVGLQDWKAFEPAAAAGHAATVAALAKLGRPVTELRAVDRSHAVGIAPDDMPDLLAEGEAGSPDDPI